MGHLLSWLTVCIILENIMTHWGFNIWLITSCLLHLECLINGNLAVAAESANKIAHIGKNEMSYIKGRQKMKLTINSLLLFHFASAFFLLSFQSFFFLFLCLSAYLLCLFYFLAALSLCSHKMTYISITKVRVMLLHCQRWQEHYTIALDWCSVNEMDAKK